jgi:uncharacterized protein YodC (DUF2158 family)
MKVKSVFEVGDTVRLKSGGPLMTVARLEAGAVVCGWFCQSDDSEPKTTTFPAEMLEQSKQ